MRSAFVTMVFAVAAAGGCGGTTFYDVEGGPPIADYRGKKVVVLPFTAGAIEGMTNSEAREAGMDGFAAALFGGPFSLVDREAIKDLLKERDLSDSDLFEGVGGEVRKMLPADAIIVGKVTTCRQQGDPNALNRSEVDLSVRGIDVQTGIQFFVARQRAVSSLGGFGIGHIRLGKRPATSAKELLTEVCKNLAAELKKPPAKPEGSP